MASPTFTRVTFVDSGAPAINATNLNAIEAFLDAISAGGFLTPTGFIQWGAVAAAPTGWLLCDGSAVSRTTYSGLFSAIGTTFGTGDGSTTFNVPDLREAGVVGVGTRGSGVTAHDTYTLGQFKDDQLQGHWTDVAIGNGGSGVSITATSIAQGTATATVSAGRAPIADGTNGTPRTGTTTHGKQIGLNGFIKT